MQSRPIRRGLVAALAAFPVLCVSGASATVVLQGFGYADIFPYSLWVLVLSGPLAYMNYATFVEKRPTLEATLFWLLGATASVGVWAGLLVGILRSAAGGFSFPVLPITVTSAIGAGLASCAFGLGKPLIGSSILAVAALWIPTLIPLIADPERPRDLILCVDERLEWSGIVRELRLSLKEPDGTSPGEVRGFGRAMRAVRVTLSPWTTPTRRGILRERVLKLDFAQAVLEVPPLQATPPDQHEMCGVIPPGGSFGGRVIPLTK